MILLGTVLSAVEMLHDSVLYELTIDIDIRIDYLLLLRLACDKVK